MSLHNRLLVLEKLTTLKIRLDAMNKILADSRKKIPPATLEQLVIDVSQACDVILNPR